MIARVRDCTREPDATQTRIPGIICSAPTPVPRNPYARRAGTAVGRLDAFRRISRVEMPQCSDETDRLPITDPEGLERVPKRTRSRASGNVRKSPLAAKSARTRLPREIFSAPTPVLHTPHARSAETSVGMLDISFWASQIELLHRVQSE